ncbi:hypothetical protein GCM10023322_72220 [Rugosimonospora acidiphila]|uniref:Bacterial sugar transferase domain-containing protein n=1 Tax=Rugosimonospora acidiphila TaxID=556531 RepID=A0ABP9SQ04_9ACTN
MKLFLTPGGAAEIRTASARVDGGAPPLDVALPDAPPLDVVPLDVVLPDSAPLGAGQPDSAAGSPPDATPPGLARCGAPSIAAPTVEVPTVEAPTVEAPTVEAPTVEAPTVEAPTVEVRTIDTATVEVPTVPARTVPTRTVPTRTVPTRTVPTRTVDPRAVESRTVGLPTVALRAAVPPAGDLGITRRRPAPPVPAGAQAPPAPHGPPSPVSPVSPAVQAPPAVAAPPAVRTPPFAPAPPFEQTAPFAPAPAFAPAQTFVQTPPFGQTLPAVGAPPFVPSPPAGQAPVIQAPVIQRPVIQAPVIQAPVIQPAGQAPPVGQDPRVTARARAAVPGRVRVVVIEPPVAGGPADRLADEFETVRLAAPIEPERLRLVLAQVRPRLLLLKHSLDEADDRLIAVCRASNVEVMVLARPVYGLVRPVRMRRFGGLPWLRLRYAGRRPGGLRVKRCIDIALTVLTAPLSVPLMVLIAAAVSVGGPPLFVQNRVGAGGRPFRLVKFRTLPVDAERDTGPVLIGRDDPRVTGVGRLLRRSRMDELPQLWNVLRGDMSLVGPRPERPEFIAEFRRALPHYDLRHLTRPGLTGIAQLTGGYAATVEEKLRCDLLYVNCRSLRLDLSLLAMTMLDALRGFPRG